MSPISLMRVAAVEGPTPGIVWRRRAVSPSRSPATRRSASRDLVLEQVVLVEQESDLEGDLGVELGNRDRVGRGGLEPLGLGHAKAPVTRSAVRVGQGRCPAVPGGCGRRRDAEHLPGRPAGGVVEQVAELREAEVDEAEEALADPRLLGHEGHREAGRLAQLDTGERVAGRVGRVAHGHLGEAPGIGRVGLRPGEPAPRKVLRRERVHHRDRDVVPAQVRGDRHPVVARRLHRHERHRVWLALDPGVEGGEADPVLADPEDLAISPGLAVPAPCRDVGPSPDVDPDRRHPGHAPSTDPRGCPLTPVDVS